MDNMWLNFLYTVQLVISDVCTKKEAEKSVIENFVREKEKWTNKGTDKQYVADSLIHSTTVHYQALYQISRS